MSNLTILAPTSFPAGKDWHPIRPVRVSLTLEAEGHDSEYMLARLNDLARELRESCGDRIGEIATLLEKSGN